MGGLDAVSITIDCRCNAKSPQELISTETGGCTMNNRLSEHKASLMCIRTKGRRPAYRSPLTTLGVSVTCDEC